MKLLELLFLKFFMCSGVLLVRGIAGNWHELCVCFSSGISQPYKSINRIFLQQIPFKVFGDIIGDQIDRNKYFCVQ